MEDIQRLVTKLMNDYGDYLKKTAYIMVNDLELAEDLVQDTFFAFYKSYNKFRGDAAYKTYLYRILMNHIKMHYRKKKTRPIQTYTEIDNPIISFEDTTIRMMDLHQAIQGLNLKQAQVIVLHYYEDMTTEEVAKTLDISKSAVKMRLKRGRCQLKELLKGEQTYEQLEANDERN